MIYLRESAVNVFLTGDKTEVNQLREHTRYQGPDYWRTSAYQLFVSSNGERGWDGYTRIIRPRRGKLGQWTCLRGLQDTLIQGCRDLCIDVDTTKLVPSPFYGLTVDDLPDTIVDGPIQPDDRQRQCIVSWLQHGHGVHHMAVATGKTLTFCATAAIIKKRFPDSRFLYLTPSERLVHQVFRESRKFLESWDITQYGGGSTSKEKNKEGKDMIVATAAMIWSNFDKLQKEGWFITFWTILADESHYCSSPSWESILTVIPAFFRLGASDTTREDDVMAFTKIHGLIGPIRERVGIEDLIKVGRIAKPTIYMVDVRDWTNQFSGLKHAPEPDSPAWALVDEEWKQAVYVGRVYEPADPDEPTEDGLKRDKKGDPIPIVNQHRMVVDGKEAVMESRWCLLERLNDMGLILFKERNNLIIQWAKHFSANRNKSLIVATRTTHVLILQALLAKAIDPDLVRILFSSHSTEERNETFKWLEETPGAVLISPLVKIGVSLPELNAGIIADHIVSHELASQVIGRFIRQKPTGVNEAKIVMFIDRQHPRLRRNSLKLLETLEERRGLSFIHPVQGPDTLELGKMYAALE